MKIKFLGHACLQIHCGGKFLIVDPFISGNSLAKNIDIDALDCDYILLTHAHQDHVLDVERIVSRTEAIIICNAEMSYYYAAKGFDVHGMNTGGSCTFDFGKLKSSIAFHSSSFADGTYGGNPNGYILESEAKRIYIAGDTSLTYEMKLIPETIGELDLAVLPIGDNFTMSVEDAYMASEFLNCNRILGYHYDTFPAIQIDHDKSKSFFSSKNKELLLLDIESTLLV